MKKYTLALILVLFLASNVFAQRSRFKNFHKIYPKAGDKAPDFEGVTKDGKKLKLSSYKDKKHVVIIFGAIT